MNRLIIILIFVLGISLAFAHPAGDVTGKYDAKTQLLEVSYAHQVKDATDHYISSVTVLVNGKNVITHNLSLQESAEGGTLIYKLPALKVGDKISVNTECSKGGKKSTNLSIK